MTCITCITCSFCKPHQFTSHASHRMHIILSYTIICYHIVSLSYCHTTILSYCHTVSYHPIIISFYHPRIQSSKNPVIHTSIHTYIHTFIRPYIHTYTCIHDTSIHQFTYIHTYTSIMYAHLGTWTLWIQLISWFNLQRGRASVDVWPLRFHWTEDTEVHSAVGRVGTVVLSIGWFRGCDPTGRIQPSMQRHITALLNVLETPCDWDQPCRCMRSAMVSWCLRVLNI